jgi:hypothetical protein
MKAETSKSPRSEATTVAVPSQTTSAGDSNDSESHAGSSHSLHDTETLISAADSSSESGETTKHSNSLPDEDTKNSPSTDAEKSVDLVGKINNLVSTDLANIVKGRDFLIFGQFIYMR